MNCRLWVFATRMQPAKRRGRAAAPQGVAWQDWNADPQMERAHGRLAGSGSFYWATPRAAYRRAVVVLRQDESVHAVRIEGIGSQPVAYVRRSDVGPRFGCHPYQLALLPRF